MTQSQLMDQRQGGDCERNASGRHRAGRGGATLQLVFGITVGRRFVTDAARLIVPRKVVVADLLARRTHDGATMHPAAGHDADVQLLARVEAFVRVVADL